jgi:hypothetical protein
MTCVEVDGLDRYWSMSDCVECIPNQFHLELQCQIDHWGERIKKTIVTDARHNNKRAGKTTEGSVLCQRD